MTDFWCIIGLFAVGVIGIVADTKTIGQFLYKGSILCLLLITALGSTFSALHK